MGEWDGSWEMFRMREAHIGQRAGKSDSRGSIRGWDRPTVSAWLISFFFHAALFSALVVYLRWQPTVPMETEAIPVGIRLEPELPSSDMRVPEDEATGPNGPLPVTQDASPFPEMPGEPIDWLLETVDSSEANEPTRDPPPQPSIEGIFPSIPEPTSKAVPETLPSNAPIGRGERSVPRSGQGPGTKDGDGEWEAKSTFFHAEAIGERIVFVIDQSASMADLDAYAVALEELDRSIQSLEATQRFQVVLYNHQATVLDIGGGDLIPATPWNKQQVRRLLDRTEPNGGTNHRAALLAALALQPDVLFFLTDADNMASDDVERFSREARKLSPRPTIHTIEFRAGPAPPGPSAIRSLAERNDGTFVRVPLRQRFPGASSE